MSEFSLPDRSEGVHVQGPSSPFNARRKMLQLGLGSAATILTGSVTQGEVTATPTETQGPFWIDPKLLRSDIRESQSGLPLYITVSVSKLSGGVATPLNSAYVDIWHCNASGAVKYDIWVNNKTTGESQVLRDQNVSGTSYTVSNALPIGQYIFWVRGIDANGTAALWSTGVLCSVTTMPTLTAPSSSTLDSTPTITWTAVEGAVAYDLFVAASGSSTATVRQTSLTSTSYTLPSSLANGTWKAWVRAAASGSYYGSWSFARTFTIGGSPTITSPTASSTVSSQPTIFWTAVDSADHYEVWVNRVDTFVNKYIYNSSVTSTSYTPTTSMAAGTYRVWIRAIAADGTLGAWSTSVTFTVA